MNETAMRWVLGLTLSLAIAFALTWRDRFDAAALQAWVESAGAAGPLLFMGLYAVATVLFLPGAVITLAGGALFGPLWGTLRARPMLEVARQRLACGGRLKWTAR